MIYPGAHQELAGSSQGAQWDLSGYSPELTESSHWQLSGSSLRAQWELTGAHRELIVSSPGAHWERSWSSA